MTKYHRQRKRINEYNCKRRSIVVNVVNTYLVPELTAIVVDYLDAPVSELPLTQLSDLIRELIQELVSQNAETRRSTTTEMQSTAFANCV